MRIFTAIAAVTLLAPTIQALAAPKGVYVPPPTRRFVWQDVSSAPYSSGLASFQRQSYLNTPIRDVYKALTPVEAATLSRITSTPASRLRTGTYLLSDIVSTRPKAEAYILRIRNLRLDELTLDYRNRIEEQTVDRNIAELELILKAANRAKTSSVLDTTKLDAILTEVAKSTAEASPPNQTSGGGTEDHRKWSYKSGSLVVKGKKGTFEYEQEFSLKGVVKTGAALGAGAELVACAFDDKNPFECIKDSLTFVHDIALPREAPQK